MMRAGCGWVPRKLLKSLRRAGFLICGPVTCKSLKLLRAGCGGPVPISPYGGYIYHPTPLGWAGEVYPG
jgi:hypothetical protein